MNFDWLTKSLITFALVLSALVVYPAVSGEVIKWKDKEGNTHFSDTEAEIPPEYRNQVEKKEYKTNKPAQPSKAPWDGGGTAPQDDSFDQDGNAGVSKIIIVPYRAFEGTSRRIIVNVRINGSVVAAMALDTGAPGVILFKSLAERVGIFDKDNAKLATKTGGIGGSVQSTFTIVDRMEVGELVSEFIPVTVTPSMKNSAFEGLLGMDFLANYQMTIDHRRHVLVFQELPPSPDRPGGHDENWWRTQFYELNRMRNGWKRTAESIKSGRDGAGDSPEFAEKQYQEADRMLGKLDSFASKHGVPMGWRQD